MKRDEMCWLESDWEHRANDDQSPELMLDTQFVDELPALVRDLVESADFYVVIGNYVDDNLREAFKKDFTDEKGFLTVHPDELNDHATLSNVLLKVIRRRNPEFQSHYDRDDMDVEEFTEENLNIPSMNVDSEDALAYVDGEYGEEYEDAMDHADLMDPSAPKAIFDLVEDCRADYSADWFPYPRAKNLSGYSRNLAAAINNGISRRNLYMGICEAQKRGVLPRSQVARLWELQDLHAFRSNPESYQLQIKGRKANKTKNK